MDFRALHHQDHPLLLANVWDVPSTLLAHKLSFKAIGTSSAAISSILGYVGGEEMSFEELAFFIRRILAHSKLPLSVDLEGGYSREVEKIFDHISQLVEWGVMGFNLEDSIVENGQRKLLQADEFAKKLRFITSKIRDKAYDIFLNVRTDCFLLPIENPLLSCLERIKIYEATGAEGIFVPGITHPKDITAVVKSTDLPINVMCMPALPDFAALAQLGVKRISMGNFLFANLESQLEKAARQIQEDQSFQSLF